MKLYLQKMICSVIILISLSFSVNAQVVSWAKSAGGISYDFGVSTTVDEEGNVYIIGSFASATISFGTTTFTNNGSFDIYLTKYDVNGNVVWAKSAGGTNTDLVREVSLDNIGNIYITGQFGSPTISFGTVILYNSGDKDIFISKYDPSGNVIWAKSFGGTDSDNSNSVSVDNLGNLYVTGAFSSPTINFGNVALLNSSNSGRSDIFITKYDSSGNVIWAKSAGGTDNDISNSVSVDNLGNLCMTGAFSSPSINFGNETLFNSSNSGKNDIFITKYDSNGNVIWAKSAGGDQIDSPNSISVDNNGNSYITGSFGSSPIIFGTITLYNSGSNDIFFAKYDSSGNVIWAKKFGGSDSDWSASITLDNNGNSYITGSFASSSITFGTETLYNSGDNDIFISKFDPNGNVIWAKCAGGTGSDVSSSVTVDNIGNIYIVGYFSNSVVFGETTLKSNGSQDVLLVKYIPETLNISSPIGSEIWQTNTDHNITWNANIDGNIQIEISTNNGNNWLILQNSVLASLGNYTFTIPPFSNSNQCKIRLTSNSISSLKSTSGVFGITSTSVPNLTIISPNTYILWRTNLIKEITWDLVGSVENVKLEYTINNGNSWNIITSVTPASTGSYYWQIPQANSILCRIRISEVGNPSLNDVSDNLFTIENLKIVCPAGGEYWKSGTYKKIEWNSISSSSYYLYYSTNNGSFWNQITDTTQNNGNYFWYIPFLSSNNCRLKIVDIADTSLYGISNLFSTWHPIISTNTPTLGQTTQTFGQTKLTLSAFILVSDSVTATYYPFQAPSTGNLPTGINAVSQYYWTVESSSLSLINGVSRVPLDNLQGITNPGNLVWLYRPINGNSWQNLGGTIETGNLVSTIAFTSLGEFAIGTTGDDPLPVELTFFNSVIKNNNALIKWETKTEINTLGFELQRIQNNEWETIYYAKGSGSSIEVSQYSYFDSKLNAGKYQYRLKMIDNDGSFKYSQIINVEIGVPKEFSLMQNYPNPFNPSTIIEYAVPHLTHVNIDVYNITGQLVKKLISEKQDAGYYIINFNPVELSSGIYFYILRAGNTVITRKMVYLK